MRTWTLVVSICAHAVAIAAVVVAPIFAIADLPQPRRPLTFETIIPIAVPDVPAPARPRTATAPAVRSIPITEPESFPPDAPAPVADPPADLVAVGGTGVPTDAFDLVGDPVVAPPQPSQVRKHPVPVGGVVRPPTRVVYVQPIYPPLALAARVEGTVILQAVIDEKGSVREVRVLRGQPLLNDAAIHAVGQWTFTPTQLNGTVVPVVMTVTVAFSLTK
jgi:protein TonB